MEIFFFCFITLTHPLPFPSSLNLSLSISFTCSHSESGSFFFLSFPLYSIISCFTSLSLVLPCFSSSLPPSPFISSSPALHFCFEVKWVCLMGSWIEKVEEGEEVERGIVGRRQVLYIAVSVGRYRIDRKDTRFLSKAKQREREG